MIFDSCAEVRILSSSAEKYLTRECKLCYHVIGNIFTREDITQIKSHVNYGKREFVPRDQVSPLIVLYFSFLLPR